MTTAPVTHGEHIQALTLAGVRLTETRHQPGLSLPCHAHAHPAITFVLEGAFTETFGSIEHVCERMSLLFKPAGAEHTNLYARCGARSFIIEPAAATLNALEPFSSLERHAPRRGAAMLAPLALHVYVAFRRGGGDESVAIDCEELTLRLLADAATTKGDWTCAPTWLTRIEELLSSEYQKSWSLSTLGTLAGVHPVYLARAFRRHFGTSIGTYLRRARVAAALRRLAERGKRGVETAYELGYCDQGHFGRAFRRETGCSPSRYQRDLLIAARFGSS